MTRPLRFLEGALEDLDRAGRLRAPTQRDTPRTLGIDLASNDYLGFASELLPTTTCGGAGASALVLGHHPAHLEAETAFAEWVGSEAALMFSSGYAANVGVVSCLVGAGDGVFSDALNHASIVDGCRLSRATTHVWPHLDLATLGELLRLHGPLYRRRLVVVESYYSMDADGPDLAALRKLCDDHDAILMVDEAHALGVFGPSGRGRCCAVGVTPDVLVGPLGKSFGLSGAFVAGPALLRTWLWNSARSFVFSTAPSPALAAAFPRRLEQITEADDRRSRMIEIAEDLREAVASAGGARKGFGPIVPWILGEEAHAMAVASRLRAAGVLAVAIRPPTVPLGTARLRLVARASLSSSEVTLACAAISASGR